MATIVKAVEDVAVERPCEALFEDLASRDPERLLAMFSELEPAFLTHAAEIAGRHIEASRVVPVLLGLLKHESPLVREGAIWGLCYHQSDEVVAILREVAMNDPSPGVRKAASDD